MAKSTRKYKKINGVPRARSRVVMEEHLGRRLLSTEVVHHINRDPSDDRLENLQVVSHAEHKRIHDEIGRETRFKQRHVLNAEEVVSLCLDKTFIEVAEQFGCDETTIRRLIKKYLEQRGLKHGVAYKSPTLRNMLLSLAA